MGQCRGGAACLGRLQPAAPGPGADEVPGPGQPEHGQTGPVAGQRARQDHPRRPRRYPARAGGGGVRHRHPAFVEGRIHRGRWTRHRRLLPTPALGRGGRHHTVQLPRHDPIVEGRPRDRLRQRLHPQAIRARPVRASASGRTIPGGRPAAGRAERGEWRQGGGGRHPARPKDQGGGLRRIHPDRGLYLRRGRGAREARPMPSAAPRTT